MTNSNRQTRDALIAFQGRAIQLGLTAVGTTAQRARTGMLDAAQLASTSDFGLDWAALTAANANWGDLSARVALAIQVRTQVGQACAAVRS